MFNSERIIFACLASVILLSSPAVLAENDSPVLLQPSFGEPVLNTPPVQIENIATAGSDIADEIRSRTGPGDPLAGKDKAEMCFGCHGEDGNSPDPEYPKLAGQYGIYLTKQMRNYLTGRLNHQTMVSMAAAASDEDLEDISAYFASQPVMKGAVPSGNGIGKDLFENDDLSRMMVSCKSCHGVAGKGLSPGNPVYPVIGGQHKSYLLVQLFKFRKGIRNNSTGGVMNTIVSRLTDAELEALADYVSGL